MSETHEGMEEEPAPQPHYKKVVPPPYRTPAV
jgi:hypothetical protein